jgi:hypothetical protein
MPRSPYTMCCFCGGQVLEAEAVTVVVRHPRYKTAQSMWAHPEHLQDAVAPSGIEVVVNTQIQHGDPQDRNSGNS